MPIYHARRFVPVSTSLDRDVLRALEHLQVALDAHGAECAIRRELPFSGTAPIQITLSLRSEEHTSELQSLMRISYAVFCLKNKTINNIKIENNTIQQYLLIITNTHNTIEHTL